MYWNLFVGLKNGLMSKMPFSRNLLPLCMWASRKSICCSCASQVNVRFGWCEFKCVMKFLSSSLPCVQIMKISSMYLFQVCGFLVHLARNSCSTESMKRFANVGANFVPMAVPHFCLSRVKISDFVTNLWLTKFDGFLLYFRVFVTK